MHFRFLEGMRPFAWAWKEIAHVMISWLARWTLEEEVQMPNVFFFFFFLGGGGGSGHQTPTALLSIREYQYILGEWFTGGGSIYNESHCGIPGEAAVHQRPRCVITNVFLIQTCYHSATVRATNQGWNSVIYAGELLDFSWPLWKGNFFTMSEDPISPTVKFSSD